MQKKCTSLVRELKGESPLKTEKRPSDRDYKWCSNVTVADRRNLQNYGDCKLN